MATSSSFNKPKTKGKELIDEVFSWSFDAVLNEDHYKGKVSNGVMCDMHHQKQLYRL